MRILVAEDDLITRRVLETSLRRWGYEIVTARDGSEALRILQSPDAPRLAILDWKMPGMDGPEVCRQARKSSGEAHYLLLLAARAHQEDVRQMIDAGADDYLIKPFDTPELKRRLEAGRRIVELQEELLHARDTLRFQATHDLVTGLWNHAAILDLLQRDLARASRESIPFAVAMADLDHFRQINESYGHSAGDQVLQETSRRMRAVLRGYDALGRFGGEEFLVILPGCAVSGASSLAERLCAAISSSPFEVPNARIDMTISIGVAVCHASELADHDLLVRAADAALRRAKSRGRNRVEIVSDLGMPADDRPAESA